MFEQPQLANLPISAATLSSAQDKAGSGTATQPGQGRTAGVSRARDGVAAAGDGAGSPLAGGCGRNPQLSQHSPERPGRECGRAPRGQPKPRWKVPCGQAGVQHSSRGYGGFRQPSHPLLHPAPGTLLSAPASHCPSPASHFPRPVPAPGASPAPGSSVAFPSGVQ